MKAYFYLLFFIFSLTSHGSYGQRPTYSEDEIIVKTVTDEMDQVFKSPDFLKKKNKQFQDITGTMVVDIGIIQSGKVATFYKVENTITNIDFINFVSEYILQHKFKFKLPKKMRHKIRYSITF